MFLLVIDFAVIIACVVLAPAYVLSGINESVSKSNLDTQSKISLTAVDQASISTAQDINGKLNLVESAENNKFIVSEKVINSIIASKSPNIKITRIVYVEKDESTGAKLVTISGIAPSREELLSFRQALEENSSFKNIDLPVSNFVKETNIQFTLTLRPS